MNGKLLISAPYLIPYLDRFRPELESEGFDCVVADVEERLSEEQLLTYASDVVGIICGDDRITERVLDAAKQLRVISKWGTGVDSIDRVAARARGVVVCNTPNAFSVPVAETAIGYILCFARNLVTMTEAMRAGSWRKIPGFALRERCLGIVGVGNVGREVARLASAFGMKIVGVDPVQPPEEVVQRCGLEMTDLETLLEQSDFVSLHCDLNPTSHHLINERSIAKMRPTAVLINTARGPVVEERALSEALMRGAIAGAALDVFEVEPLPKDSPLRTMSNVLLAPHNSNSSPGAWERVHRNTIDNVLRVLKGRDVGTGPVE